MPPLDIQPLELLDFSGGVTDNYINGPLNRAQIMENLLLVRHSLNPIIAKPITRPGCQLYSTSFALATGTNQRVEYIKRFGTNDLVFYARKVSQLAGGGWTEVVGPVTSNSLFPSGTTVSNVVSMAEWNEHLLVTNDAFARPSKLYYDGSAVLQLRTAGLPALASDPTVTPGANTGKSYIYRFVHEYTYTVGTVVYKDISAVVELLVDNADAPETNANAISNIPVLANGAVTNWDTASIKIGIYRTTDGGVNLYKVGEVTNGTTTFNDNVSDATLVGSEPLYTEGGVVENDAPPLCKLVHVVGDIAYYAHIKDGNEIHKNEIRQAIPGDIDSVPSDFSAFVQDEIVGISSAKSLPVLICKNSAYRIEGQYDELGRGGMVPIKISDTSTCISSKSVVQTLEGVFWWGEDHIYYTDGYAVMKLNKQWAKTYLSFVDSTTKRSRVAGKYDKHNRRIWWNAQLDSGSNDCDTAVVLELDYGISEESSFSFQVGTDSWSPTALEFIGNQMIRGHRQGYIFLHDDAIYNDLEVNTLTTPSTWNKLPIDYRWRSVAFNCGTNFIRKFGARIVVTCENRTNLSLSITSINDDGRKIQDLKPIRFRGNLDWGDPDVVWGDPSIPWNFDGLILEQRRFPSNSLRFSYKQLEIKNASIVRSSSDILGTATVNSVAKTALLDNATISDWPSDVLGSFLSFEFDNYTREYRVTVRADNTLTFADSDNTVQAGSWKWVLKGYPVNESLQLLSIVLPYSYLGRTQNTYTAADSGVPA